MAKKLWMPKSMRLESDPSVSDIIKLINAAKANNISSNSLSLFINRGLMLPAVRLKIAISITVNKLFSCSVADYTELLTRHELGALYELAELDDAMTTIAEQLFCFRERMMLAKFLSKAKDAVIDCYDKTIKPLDIEE